MGTILSFPQKIIIKTVSAIFKPCFTAIKEHLTLSGLEKYIFLFMVDCVDHGSREKEESRSPD